MTYPKTLLRSIRLLVAPLSALAVGGTLISCQDETPTVGGQLATGEVQIAVDSLIWNGTEQTIYRGDIEMKVSCPSIDYQTIFDNSVDTRSTTNLLGRISVPEYGDLNCSFVSRMMCTTRIDIPDSIPLEQVDSMKLIMSVTRGALTGDSLAPQQLRVFQLTKSLPDDIDNRFDPTGYYNPSNPLGTRSFTLSALGMSDSIYINQRYVSIQIPMTKQMARDVVSAYRNDNTKSIFAWPQTFEEYFHGIYVEPTFGRGCVANISNTKFVIFYNYKTQKTSTDSEGTVSVKVETNVGAAGVFASSPIVLSSNNVAYRPSEYLRSLAAEGKALVTSPGGYRISLKFPGRELVDIYRNSQSKLAVVSNLSFTIPVEEITNDYEITPPPYLVMVKTSKLKEFLASNSLPDNKDSFYAKYYSGSKCYAFLSMRNYILDLIKNGVQEDDLDFTLIPVNLEFEKENSNTNTNSYLSLYYGITTSSSNTNTEPIKCTPYILKPSMCRLKMDEARTVFTYSIQQLK